MSKKPENTALADQLKAVAAKMEKDTRSQVEAERKAKARQQEALDASRRAKESGLSEEERFLKAVGGIQKVDTAKKFEDSPRAKKEAEAALRPAGTEDDQFLAAMQSTAPGKK